MAQWLETEYFDSFACKCGSCRHTCCCGWQIDVNQQEYFRLLGMRCSPALQQRLDCAFAVPENVSDTVYRVLTPNWQGLCHLLDTDGLCLLQKECGGNALPKVCKYYPRSLQQAGTHRLACCSASCEAVVERLLALPQLQLVQRERVAVPLLYEEETEADFSLLLRCIRLLQQRALPLTERILRVCVAIGCDELPTEQQLDDALTQLLRFSPALPTALERACAPHAQTERHKENLLCNHLMYTNFPHTDSRLAPHEAAYGLLLLHRLLCRADGHAGDALVDAYAEVFRLSEHTAFSYNAAVLLRPHMRAKEESSCS